MDVGFNIIARVHTEFPEKFGIPRQSGLVPSKGRIVFEPEYRNPDAVCGMEGYSYIWLIWQFSKNAHGGWSPKVRPPRLGGNKRVGVFATRSPYRPNSIGLSSVKLEKIEYSEKDGPVLIISGADLANGTPILDIKPYLAFTDSHPDAVCGFSDDVRGKLLNVKIPKNLKNSLPREQMENLIKILENDPRPSYHSDPERVYAVVYAGAEIKFTVNMDCLTVCSIEDLNKIV